MSHQNNAMRAGGTSYSPQPEEKVDTNPSDQQPPGVDEEENWEPQSLEEALLLSLIHI